MDAASRLLKIKMHAHRERIVHAIRIHNADSRPDTIEIHGEACRRRRQQRE